MTARLTAQEECELGARSLAGDRAARDRLIEANLGLCHRAARAYLGHGIDLEDLVGYGTLGLIRAAEDFDPSLGLRFSTLAVKCIRTAIQDALTNQSRLIRVAANAVRLRSKINRAARRGQEVAITGGQAMLLAQADRVEAAGRDRTGHAMGRMAARGESPHAVVDAADEARYLRSLLCLLTPDERRVVELRTGLDGGEGATLAATGRAIGFSREQARILETLALRRLRWEFVGKEIA